MCNETHEYMCQDQKRCIPRVFICNNDTDCDDGSDELNCTVTQLAPVNVSLIRTNKILGIFLLMHDRLYPPTGWTKVSESLVLAAHNFSGER